MNIEKFCKVYGNPKNKSLIFIHNGGTDQRVWDYQVKYFQSDYFVMTFDLPGFGSQVYDTNYSSLNNFVKYLAAVIDFYQLKSCSIIGNCIGAATALMYSLENQNVEKLILFNLASYEGILQGNFGKIKNVIDHQKYFKLSLQKIFGKIKFPSLILRQGLKYLIENKILENPKLRDLMVDIYSKNNIYLSLINLDTESFKVIDEGYDQNKSNDIIAKATLIWGAENQVLPVSVGEKLFYKWGFGEFVKLKNLGHLMMLEEPDLINKKISDILHSKL